MNPKSAPRNPWSSKRALRRSMTCARESISKEQHRVWSTDIVAHLVGWLEVQDFPPKSRIGLYASRGSEATLDGAVPQIVERGFEVVWPVLSLQSQLLRFAPEADVQSLIPGRWGIRQPRDLFLTYAAEELAVCCLPGLVFGPRGERVGSGRGFYDRTLRAYQRDRQPVRIGVGFSVQTLVDVPREPCDVPCEYLVNERGMHSCAST